jgi:hypothetical protein
VVPPRRRCTLTHDGGTRALGASEDLGDVIGRGNVVGEFDPRRCVIPERAREILDAHGVQSDSWRHSLGPSWRGYSDCQDCGPRSAWGEKSERPGTCARITGPAGAV